jgi:hypothetical protein
MRLMPETADPLGRQHFLEGVAAVNPHNSRDEVIVSWFGRGPRDEDDLVVLVTGVGRLDVAAAAPDTIS